jgi:hypothetical protein
MTTETRTIITPSDVIGMGFECSHCHAVFIVPIDKIDRLADHCPNCRQDLLRNANPLTEDERSDQDSLKYFVQFLKDVRQRGFGKWLRFEIKPEGKE